MHRATTRWSSVLSTSSNNIQMEDAPAWMFPVDLAFALCFTIELVLRFLVDEHWFLLGANCGWNLIDILVVVFAWLEIGLDSKGMPPLRLFRLLRALRSLRLVRAFRFFTDLRLVLLSLLHSIKPLMWCCFTFTLILFVFANLFMQMLGEALQKATFEASAGNTWTTLLLPKFSSSSDSMVLLFGLVTGGDDWFYFYEALLQMSPSAGMVFVMFIVAVILGVLNVISAVFVEGAISKAKGDHDLMLAEGHQNQQDVAQELVTAFHSIDTNHTNHISCDEWLEFTASEAGKDFLTLFCVDPERVRPIFKILDLDDSGEIEIQEFVVGFMRMNAHGADTMKQYEIETSLQSNKALLRKCVQIISESRKDVSSRIEDVNRNIELIREQLVPRRL